MALLPLPTTFRPNMRFFAQARDFIRLRAATTCRSAGSSRVEACGFRSISSSSMFVRLHTDSVRETHSNGVPRACVPRAPVRARGPCKHGAPVLQVLPTAALDVGSRHLQAFASWHLFHTQQIRVICKAQRWLDLVRRRCGVAPVAVLLPHERPSHLGAVISCRVVSCRDDCL